MKYVLISTVAALGFASAATADSTFANDTLMTRNVPAASVLGPRNAGLLQDGYLRVTVGQKVVQEADDQLHPSELGQAQDGTVVSYDLGGAVSSASGGYTYR